MTDVPERAAHRRWRPGNGTPGGPPPDPFSPGPPIPEPLLDAPWRNGARPQDSWRAAADAEDPWDARNADPGRGPVWDADAGPGRVWNGETDREPWHREPWERDPGAAAGVERPPARRPAGDARAGRPLGRREARAAGDPDGPPLFPQADAVDDGFPAPAARHGAAARAAVPDREPRTPGQAALGAVLEVVVVLSLALLLSLLIKTFLVQAFFIPSESMENTLLKGDRVLVNKLAPGPMDLHRGDVVVFKDPGGWLDASSQPADEGGLRGAVRSSLTFVGLLPQDSGEHLIKRVVGLPGDRVVCCDRRSRIVVNGVAVSEPYLFAGDAPSTKTFDVTVPAGRLWVMGDHRSVSFDSRFHGDLPTKGFVPIDDVVGQAFVVVWPFDRAGRLSVPPSVFSAVPAPAAR